MTSPSIPDKSSTTHPLILLFSGIVRAMNSLAKIYLVFVSAFSDVSNGPTTSHDLPHPVSLLGIMSLNFYKGEHLF